MPQIKSWEASDCTFNVGIGPVSSWRYGGRDWLSMTRWKALPGTEKRGRGQVQSAAGGGVRRANSADRGKNGRKRSLLVDGSGVTLSLVAGGANVHDVKLLAATVDKVVRARPAPRARTTQHLDADAGYKGAYARRAVEKRYDRPLIKQGKEEADGKRKRPGYKTRRWVVERTHSWLNRFLNLLVSFEKTETGYVALLALAAAVICWRPTISIYRKALNIFPNLR